MESEDVTYDRNTLYEEVWAAPVREVAKRYRISDVALAKTCRKLGIPLPPRGYWLRPESKRARSQLPAAKPGMQVRWQVRIPIQEPPPPLAPALASRLAEEAEAAAIIVPSELVAPHKIIVRSANALRRATTHEGFVTSAYQAGCLNIRVAPSSVDRALRVMNSLINALETRGLKIRVRETEPRAGYARSPNEGLVTVDDEEVSILLWEKYSLRPTGKKGLLMPRNERIPNGRFNFEIRHPDVYCSLKTWTETATKKLDGLLNQIISQFYLAAARLKEERVERERARVEREAEEKRARAAEALRRAEAERLDVFKGQLKRWRFASDARAFLDEIRILLTSRGLRPTKGAHVEEWMNWIAARADEADPLTRMRRDAEEMATQYRTRRPAIKPFASRLARARRPH